MRRTFQTPTSVLLAGVPHFDPAAPYASFVPEDAGRFAGGHGGREGGRSAEDVARSVAVGWVLGDLKSLPGTGPASLRQKADTEVRKVWKNFRALPRAEQLSRIDAMRAAALSCEGDALDALTGGASR